MALLSRKPKEGQSLSKEKLNAVIDRIVVKDKAGADSIVTAPDFAALPEDIKAEAYNQGGDGSDIKCVFHRKSKYKKPFFGIAS